MEAKAIEKYIRMSARKVRYLVDLIKSKPVEDAVDILSFTPGRAAIPLKKAIQSAAANAVENNNMKEEDLFVSKISIDEGPTLKRYRPRARGRADRIRKRTCHITVYVSDGDTEGVKASGPKGKS